MESQVFQNYLSKVLVADFKDKRPILLIYDGHTTHVSISLIEEAMKEQVTILKLPPHSSHLLQPLDVAVFKPIKDRWDAKLVKWQRDNPGKKILKKNFSLLTKTVWKETDPVIIQNGFKKAGIYPFNDQVIAPEKFDPAAYKRWQTSRTEIIHVTGEDEADDLNREPVVLMAGPSGPSANSSSPERNEGTTIITKSVCPSQCHTSFDQILAATMKTDTKNNDEKKPKKRVAGGAEVITRNEVLLRLKEKETVQKKTKEKKTKITLALKVIPR